MSVERDGRPSGPYSDISFGALEHDQDDGWWGCDSKGCIHNFADSIAWVMDEAHPPPSADGLDHITDEDLIFGFPSTAALIVWFNEHLDTLDRFGFVVGVYETDDYQHGRRQSVFKYSSASRVDEWSIVDVAIGLVTL